MAKAKPSMFLCRPFRMPMTSPFLFKLGLPLFTLLPAFSNWLLRGSPLNLVLAFK